MSDPGMGVSGGHRCTGGRGRALLFQTAHQARVLCEEPQNPETAPYTERGSKQTCAFGGGICNSPRVIPALPGASPPPLPVETGHCVPSAREYANPKNWKTGIREWRCWRWVAGFGCACVAACHQSRRCAHKALASRARRSVYVRRRACFARPRVAHGVSHRPPREEEKSTTTTTPMCPLHSPKGRCASMTLVRRVSAPGISPPTPARCGTSPSHKFLSPTPAAPDTAGLSVLCSPHGGDAASDAAGPSDGLPG